MLRRCSIDRCEVGLALMEMGNRSSPYYYYPTHPCWSLTDAESDYDWLCTTDNYDPTHLEDDKRSFSQKILHSKNQPPSQSKDKILMNHTSKRSMTVSAEFHIDTNTNIVAKTNKAEDDTASYSTIASHTPIDEANFHLSTRKSSHDSKAIEPRASDIEDASQGLLSFKQKGRKRASPSASPASPTYGEQEKGHAYKRPKSRSDSLNSLSRSPYLLLGQEQDKKVLVKPTKTQSISTSTLSQENRKKNEIINIAQKNLKTAMDILSAYNKSKPSSSQDVFRNTTDTNMIKGDTNPASRSASFDPTSPRAAFSCTSHDSASSSISVNSGVSNASDSSPKLSSTNNKVYKTIHSNLQLRAQDIEGRMIKLKNHFMSEMAHLQQELIELKQNNYSFAAAINEDNSNKRHRSVATDGFSMKKDNSNLQTIPYVSHSRLHNALTLTPERHTKISASDSNSTSLPLITEPTDKDVISGRGHGANRHGGNQTYRNLVKKYKVQYVKAIADLDKHQISMQVVNEIHEDGGRFLKRVYGHECVQWEVMDMNEIKKKVSQALRENASDLRNILSQQSRNASPVLHAGVASSPSPPLVIMSSNRF